MALETIFRITKGSPRKLCKLCDNALVAIFLKGAYTADESVIVAVARDIRLQEEQEHEIESLDHHEESETEGEGNRASEKRNEEGVEQHAPLPEVSTFEGDNMKQTYGDIQ